MLHIDFDTLQALDVQIKLKLVCGTSFKVVVESYHGLVEVPGRGSDPLTEAARRHVRSAAGSRGSPGPSSAGAL